MSVNSSFTTCVADCAPTGVDEFLRNFTLYLVAIVSPCAIVLNLIALFTFARVKDILPSSTRLLMIHQAYIEVCSSSLAIVQQVTRHVNIYFPPGAIGMGLCMTYDVAYWAFDVSLQLNCVLITIDRYLAVCHVMKRYMTVRRTVALIVLVQLIGWLYMYGEDIALLRVDPATGMCYYLDDTQASRPWGIVYVFYEVAPIACVIFIYPTMIYALVKSSKQVSGVTQLPKTKLAAMKRLIRTGLIAAIVLVIANMPDTVFFSIMYAVMGDNPGYFDSWEQTMDYAFKSFYPLFCPIIYSFSTPKFRAAVPVAFRFRSARSDS